jgi:hypothetical protein
MQFHIAKAAAVTGRLLNTIVEDALRQEGVQGLNAHVCYGVGYQGNDSVLNGNCSRHSKLQQAKLLQEGLGLASLVVYDTSQDAMAHLLAGKSPLFARTAVHSQGRDIKIALEPWQIEPLMRAGTAFFTAHEPSVREFRTWVYRKRHLGTYEKVLRRPEDCKRLGRNYANGFDFSGIEHENVPAAMQEVAKKAVKVLGLDFGAVDILQAPDGHFVVLEVNSAPGVAHEKRKVIQNLAHRITRWVVAGCPARED